MLSRRSENALSELMEIVAESESKLRISPGHCLRAGANLMPPGALKTGDHAQGGKGEMLKAEEVRRAQNWLRLA